LVRPRPRGSVGAGVTMDCATLGRTGKPATRFIILCAARTGSTMLRHMLNSHPNVRCHGEVMTGRGLDSLAGDRDGDAAVTRTLLDRRGSDPQGFLEDVVLDPGSAKAVGFKIKYEELLLSDYAWLLGWLKSHREIRVIHLTRENRLKRLVSEVTATKVYRLYNVTSEAERPRAARIFLSAAECLGAYTTNDVREAIL